MAEQNQDLRRGTSDVSSSSGEGTQADVEPTRASLIQRKIQRRALQRKADAAGAGANPEAALESASRDSGRALDAPIARKVEAATGSDLSGVRVHTGAASETAAAAVSAQAYTVGQDIHFGAGQYNPGSASGDRLIAHELVHTVQQQGGGTSHQNKLDVSQPGDSAEVEADAIADAIVDNKAVAAPTQTASGTARKAEEAAAPTTATPAPAEKEGGGTVKKVAHTDPKEADKLIQKEMATFCKDLKTGDVAVGRVKVVDDAKFKVVYLRYIGDDGEYAQTNAFVERNSPDGGDIVWIHEQRGNAGTVIHEAMHLYSNTSFKTKYGRAANEGTTEFLTRIITDKLKITRSNYDAELGAVKVLAGKVTNATLAGAYLSGSFDALRKAGGEAKFDAWVTAMKADDYATAKTALA